MTVDLATAMRIVAAAHAEAVRRSVVVSAAVVDAGGHLVVFGRMDAAPGGELFGLHANGGGRFVIFGGGVPIFADGNVVGGVGVSGASTADDESCALAGLAALG